MKNRTIVMLAGALLAAVSGTASANGRISVGIGIGLPAYGYVAPPPVTYAPPPVTYAPPLVTYAPPPVYYAPPPVYYAPAPWGVRYYGYWGRGWGRHHGYGHRGHW